MQSLWKLSQDLPGEVVELSGLWPPHRLRALRFERASKRIIQRPLFGASTSLSFSSLRSVRFVVGPVTGRDLRLQLSLSFTKEGAPQTWSVFFRVAQIDKGDEALDLIFRIAQVLGWPSFLLYRRDEGGIDLELLPERDDPFRAAQSTHQVPLLEQRADYQSTQSLGELSKKDPQRPRFREPREKVPFTPTEHRAVKRWDDKAIVLQKAPAFGPVGAFFYLLLGLPAILFLCMMVELLQLTLILAVLIVGVVALVLPLALFDDTPEWLIGGPLLLVMFGVGLFALYRLSWMPGFVWRAVLGCFSREVSFELVEGALLARRATYFWARWRISSISAITLVARENKSFKFYLSKEERERRGDRCYEIRARLGWVNIPLWEGKEDAQPNREESFSLAVGLARALDVPFREE